MFRPRRWWSVVKACGCCFVLGCVPALQGTPARDINRQTPDIFPALSSPADVTSSDATSLAQQTWSEFFTSPGLRDLIGAALTSNQELNIRLQEIVIALNEVSARQGEYLPKVRAGGGVGVEKVGKFTSQGESDDATRLPENLGDFTFGLVGSWEVDIWKKLRNAKQAADFRYMASIEARNFLVTQIIAEIARTYYELLSLDQRIDILKRNIELQENMLELVKLQKQAARVTELAVQRFEAELFKNKSHVFDLEQDRIQTENRINFLVGRYPQSVVRNVQEFQEPLPSVLRLGLPAELLDNRPDVRQAELEVAASKLDAASAKAAFYPALTIDAGLGYRSFNIEHIVTTPASLFYNAAGGLVAPLLNRKAITAQYESANARQVQAVFDYERTLLQAFTDVANQVAALNNLRHVYDLLTQEVDTLERALDISIVLFQSARAQYIDVLLARRDYLSAEMELIDSKKEQFQALINIYQSLGGGWRPTS